MEEVAGAVGDVVLKAGAVAEYQEVILGSRYSHVHQFVVALYEDRIVCLPIYQREDYNRAFRALKCVDGTGGKPSQVSVLPDQRALRLEWRYDADQLMYRFS